jgi:hypothetical protein
MFLTVGLTRQLTNVLDNVLNVPNGPSYLPVNKLSYPITFPMVAPTANRQVHGPVNKIDSTPHKGSTTRFC